MKLSELLEWHQAAAHRELHVAEARAVAAHLEPGFFFDEALARRHLKFHLDAVQAIEEFMDFDTRGRAAQLISECEAANEVVTISLVPREPPAMGNYKMVAEFRDARIKS